MVQILFFIRFIGQLRRTKPVLISSLENTVAAAVSAAGGTLESERKFLRAFFDEDRIGFWLDMLILLEKFKDILEKAAPELYGYTLVLGRDIPEASGRVCRSLSEGKRQASTGIWCSREVLPALESYLVFGSPERIEGEGSQNIYCEIREWKSPRGDIPEHPYREKTEKMPALKSDKNTILLGPKFADTKDGLYHYSEEFLGDVPPLVVRFGAGGRGLICFADAYTPRMQSFIFGAADAVSGETAENLDAAAALLFRERLREEWSPYMMEQGRYFIHSLLTSYILAAKTQKPKGILILEDISLASTDAARIFGEVYSSLDDKEGLLLLAADSSSEKSLDDWRGVFPRVLDSTSQDSAGEACFDHAREYAPAKPPAGSSGGIVDSPGSSSRAVKLEKVISKDLWEVIYIISLLVRYFPIYLLPQLIEEEGLNRDMYFRALTLLKALGITSGDDPRPQIPGVITRAEKVLGKRKEKIRSAVKNRILSWTDPGREPPLAGVRPAVIPGRLSPCFNLLRILSELGEQAMDALFLRALRSDVLNGTWKGIEEAQREGYFTSLAGANSSVLLYIYETLKVLVWGNKHEIWRGFETPVPSLTLEDGRACYGAYQAQVQMNLAAFDIGRGNIDAASEEVRKAMLLNRNLGKEAIPVYRLFSLVNLSRQRIDDALEYSSFALEQIEKTEQREELILTCYFASSINFLYGNLSKAERLALRAEETARVFGQPFWAARAAFLRGRLNFEIGRYDEALEIFESLGVETPPAANDTSENSGAASRQKEMTATVLAWINRTKIFLGRTFSWEAGTVPAGSDSRIFEIEAAYFAADYEKSAALAGDFLSPLREETAALAGENFLFTEQPDWRSGFAQCEYMFRPEKIPGSKMVGIYQAMAQCALNPAREAKMKILDGIQRFMRDELLPDTNPNDVFYLYAWYSMLRKVNAAQVDMNTVVSMAFKRLQRRAGRIDNKETKQAFLTLPRWSKTLSLAAKEYKLI